MNGTDTTIAGRYTLGEIIGHGGMGIVYKGTDTQSGRSIAVKQLKSSVIAQSESMVARFEQEAEALRRLNHPNIVKVLDTVQLDQTHYIVMEYVPGGTLRQLLDRNEPIPMKRALTIMLELADALTRAHHLGIVHRDLKPGNVLLADDGTPRLTDFGVARIENRERLTDEDVSVGTLDYIAPEVLENLEADKRSDVWAFGVMMYEILTGQRPFDAATTAGTVAAILARDPDDVRDINPEIPQGLAYLIEGMMIRDPNLRINSVRQVGAEIEMILSEEDNMPTFIGRFRTPSPAPAGDLSTPVMGIPLPLDTPTQPRNPTTTTIDRQSVIFGMMLVVIGAVILAIIVGTSSNNNEAATEQNFNLSEATLVTSMIDTVISSRPLEAVPLTSTLDEDGSIIYTNNLYSLRTPAAWAALDINNTLGMLDRVTDGSDTFTNIIGEPDKLDLITAELLTAEGVAVRRERLLDAFDTEALLGWVPFMMAEINLPIEPGSERVVKTPSGDMVRVDLRVEDQFIGPDNFQVYFTMRADVLYWIIFYTPEPSFDHIQDQVDGVLTSFEFAE